MDACLSVHSEVSNGEECDGKGEQSAEKEPSVRDSLLCFTTRQDYSQHCRRETNDDIRQRTSDSSTTSLNE